MVCLNSLSLSTTDVGIVPQLNGQGEVFLEEEEIHGVKLLVMSCQGNLPLLCPLRQNSIRPNTNQFF